MDFYKHRLGATMGWLSTVQIDKDCLTLERKLGCERFNAVLERGYSCICHLLLRELKEALNCERFLFDAHHRTCVVPQN